MKYYHGTNDAYDIKSRILPSLENEEVAKNIYSTGVLITSSLMTAMIHTQEIVKKYGGKPRIYLVKPDFESLYQLNGNNYECKYADILKRIV